jgi:hypothetical protein
MCGYAVILQTCLICPFNGVVRLEAIEELRCGDWSNGVRCATVWASREHFDFEDSTYYCPERDTHPVE